MKYLDPNNIHIDTYLNQLSKQKIALSHYMDVDMFNSANEHPGELCYRDIEMMAIGVPYIRIEYKSEIHEAFIPNYHYITIPREHAFLEFDKNGVTKREKIFPGIGRVRDVNIGPDGYAYISVEAIGIFKILPK